MAFHLHAILATLSLAFMASQAALPGEVYWNSLLPNTTMPRAISNVLLPGEGEEIVPDGGYGRSHYGRNRYGRSHYGRRHYTLNTEENGEVAPDLKRSGYSRKKYTPDTDEKEEIAPDLKRSGYSRKKYTPDTEENGEVEPDLKRSGYSRKKYTPDTDENGEIAPDLKRSGYSRKKYTPDTEENEEVEPDLKRSGYSRKKYTPDTDENGEIAPDLKRSGYSRKKYTPDTEENGEVEPDLKRSGYSRKKYTPDTEENGEVEPDLKRSGYSRKKYTPDTDENVEVVPNGKRNSYSRKKYTPDTDENVEVVPNGKRNSYSRKKYNGGRLYKKEGLVNPPSAPWFLEKDLYPGKEMEMEIARPENDGYIFVPRKVADSIPFSSDKFPAILSQLSIKPESPKAELIRATVKECELPAEEGEVKTCATSLESMIDFSIQQLGKNIQAVSTEAEKDTKLQKFTMLKGIEQIGKEEAVACHKQNYAYAVFYCHNVKGAKAYTVPFIGTSGTKVKAVGVCHTNTTAWSPEHEAFKILKVKPGGESVCHFLPEYNVLWTRK